MRHAMGVAVFFGMLCVTVFGLAMTPVFYVALRPERKPATHLSRADRHRGSDVSGASLKEYWEAFNNLNAVRISAAFCKAGIIRAR
jgi:hypothetical protein